MMKDIMSLNPPASNDYKWRDDLLFAEIKRGQWHAFRLVGGFYSYAQHWVEFNTKTGEKKRFPIDCRNWNQETEKANADNDCPACAADLKISIHYLVNVIDRNLQATLKPGSGASPIRVLDLAPTTLRDIISTSKLNIHNGQAVPVVHPTLGCDLYLRCEVQGKRTVWSVQKGDQKALTAEELEYDPYDFDTIHRLPEADDVRKNLQRLHIISDTVASERVPEIVTEPVNQMSIPNFSQTKVADVQTIASFGETASTPKSAATPAVNVAVHPVPTQTQTTQALTDVSAVAASPTGRMDCFPDGTPGKKFLGSIKCMMCKDKTACMTASTAA